MVKVGSEDTYVDSRLVKFVPVKMSWRGQSWLGPYILAHTTTKWWNHAVTVSIPVAIHNLKTKTNTASIQCMPSLVVVDVTENTFPPTESLYIGNSYKTTFEGNSDFGKIAHKIIGQNTKKPVAMVDFFAAWKVMCKDLLSHVKPSSIEIQLAVLSTSRFNGFSVWTDEAKAKKTDSLEMFMPDLNLDEAPQSFDEWLEEPRRKSRKNAAMRITEVQLLQLVLSKLLKSMVLITMILLIQTTMTGRKTCLPNVNWI